MTATKDELEILIVDDNLINRNNMMTQVNLLLPNVIYAEAINGQMAVDVVKERIDQCGKNFSVIIMDFCMPIMNGEMATAAIRNLEKTAKLRQSQCAYIITWSTSKQSPYPGANTVLHKPIIQTELASILGHYLA